MTDITDAITRIRAVAITGQGKASADDDTWNCESFESILHNLNHLEAAMTTDTGTDTTDAAQWWRVEHCSNGDEWSVTHAGGGYVFIQAIHEFLVNAWTHVVFVHCTRADAEQAAVDAWADAGFVHAPKEPPGPKQAEGTWYAVQNTEYNLIDVAQLPGYATAYGARESRDRITTDDNRYRIVKVEATVSEVTE